LFTTPVFAELRSGAEQRMNSGAVIGRFRIPDRTLDVAALEDGQSKSLLAGEG
jgi:hypothetical protein